MYNTIGKSAIRFAITYIRRRYRRPIRIVVGIAAVVVGIAAYLLARDVPEG